MHRHVVAQLFLALLLTEMFLVFADSPNVYSQILAGCNVVGIAPTGPPIVGAGQTLQVTTAVTGSCDQSMFYAVRVDLVDGRSSQVLSSVVFPYAPVSAVFTVSITNTATAPTTLGSWVLQINAYLIASLNGGIVASAHQLFSVVVVQYTPTTTTTSEQMTANSTTTTIILAPVNSTSQMTSISELSSTTSGLSAVAESTNQNGTLIAAAALLVVLAALVLMMLSRRKRTDQKPRPQESSNMKFCAKCGTKLAADDEFCGHCGTKQG